MRTKKDLRKNRRAACLVPVEGNKGSAFEHTLTIDISRDGIGFISDREISVDDKIAVELELSPEGDFVVKIGKVMWVRKVPDKQYYRFGMQLRENQENQ